MEMIIYLWVSMRSEVGRGWTAVGRLWPGVVEFAVRQVAPMGDPGYVGGTRGAGVCSQCPGCITPLPPAYTNLQLHYRFCLAYSAPALPHFVQLIIHLTSPNCFFTRIPAVFRRFTSWLRVSILRCNMIYG